VHLPYCCQCLLLRQLRGALRQPQPLTAHTYCSTADNDDIVTCSMRDRGQLS
jgi:hypothetical protein